MSDEIKETLERFEIPMAPEGLVQIQTLLDSLTDTLSETVSSARGKVDAEVSRIEGSVTDEDTIDVSRFADNVFDFVGNLEGEDRARYLSAFAKRFTDIVEWAESEIEDYAASQIEANASETLGSATNLYEDARALKDAGTKLYGALSMFGNVPKEVRTTTRKVKGGNETTVLDWPRVENPSNVSAKTGTRSYTRKAPVWTVDGTEIPHGTKTSEVGRKYLSTPTSKVTSALLLSMCEKAAGKDYTQTGGAFVVNEHEVSFTDWRVVE